MNRAINNAFSNISEAVLRHMSEVNETLADYRRAKESTEKSVKVYADPDKYFNEWKKDAVPAVRKKIAESQTKLHEAVLKETKVLRDELSNQLLVVPHDNFMKQIQLFQGAHIAPSELELKALVSLSAGSPVAIRALNSLLTEMKSPFRIEGKSLQRMSKDLADLEKLGTADMPYFSFKFHTEACELYKETERYPGKIVGLKWNPSALITATTIFDSFAKHMPELEAHWKDVIPSVRQASDEELYPDSEKAVEEFVADTLESINSPEIAENADAIAKIHAEQVKQDRAAFEHGIGYYRS